MPNRDERVWALARFLAEREDAGNLFDVSDPRAYMVTERAEFDRFMMEAGAAIDRLDELNTASVEYTARTLLNTAVDRANAQNLTGPHVWAQLAAVAVDVDAAEQAARFRVMVDEQIDAAAVVPTFTAAAAALLAEPVAGNCRACTHPDSEHYSSASTVGRGCAVPVSGPTGTHRCGCQLDAEYCTYANLPTLDPVGHRDAPVNLNGAPTPAYVFDLLECIVTGAPLDFHGHPVPADVRTYIENSFEVAAENDARNDPAPAGNPWGSGSYPTCKSHGAHPHGGVKCLDCPRCIAAGGTFTIEHD